MAEVDSQAALDTVTASDMRRVVLEVKPLTRQKFRAFGFVIDVPTSGNKDEYPTPSAANQGSALRFGDISFLTSGYHNTTRIGKPVLSLFSCSPRQVEASTGLLELDVLEQHPYTSQTFAPLGLDQSDATCLYVLVIVAPTLWSEPGRQSQPDLNNIQVFVANGSQAVTYAAGTWHAPMIVMGTRTVNFLVVQNMNDVPEDNCQELPLGEKNVQILVRTENLNVQRAPLTAKL